MIIHRHLGSLRSSVEYHITFDFLSNGSYNIIYNKINR